MMEKYRPGGYHPMDTGDVLKSRYHVVHKLGYGGSSTIWLARDEQHADYVAVKVSTGDALPNEIRALHSLAKSRPSHSGLHFFLAQTKISWKLKALMDDINVTSHFPPEAASKQHYLSVLF